MSTMRSKHFPYATGGLIKGWSKDSPLPMLGLGYIIPGYADAVRQAMREEIRLTLDRLNSEGVE